MIILLTNNQIECFGYGDYQDFVVHIKDSPYELFQIGWWVLRKYSKYYDTKKQYYFNFLPTTIELKARNIFIPKQEIQTELANFKKFGLTIKII